MEVESKILGQLNQLAQFPDWWEATVPLAVPFFDGLALPATFMDVPLEPAAAAQWAVAADAALQRFLALGPEARRAATPLALANYQETLDASDMEPLEGIDNPDDIWRFVQPRFCYLRRDGHETNPEQPGAMYVQISCECDWEEEHGLVLVFREGRMLTRLSQQDGHLTEGHADDRPDDEDPLMTDYYAAYGRPE